VRLAKSGSAFCYPEYIDPETHELFAARRAQTFLQDRSPDAFAMALPAFSRP
jgi:capsule polysaccharide export protein KpsC/LpsZ